MTKKIAVVAANGRAGSLIVEEAVRRGFDVTAIVRGENRTAAQNSVIKDALELTTEDLEGFDAVVDAVGGWTPETIPGITDAGIHLADVLVGTDVRLLIVGGAGSLFVNPEHTVTVDMGLDFPDDWKPLSAAAGKVLAHLRETDGLKWTFISPAADFQPTASAPVSISWRARSSRSTAAASQHSRTLTMRLPWSMRSSPVTTSPSASRL